MNKDQEDESQNFEAEFRPDDKGNSGYQMLISYICISLYAGLSLINVLYILVFSSLPEFGASCKLGRQARYTIYVWNWVEYETRKTSI